MGMKYDPGTDAFYMCVDDYPKESEYHFENAYYIRYNIDKALYALNMISSYSHESEPSCFLCHTNVDLLFEACGLIHNRFCEKERMSEAHRQQIRNNVFEYGFDKDSYPLLSEKDYRNFIEHIDERGRFLIREDVFHGTFNVVYAGMDEDLRQGLTNPDKQQNNTLNLEEMTYTILDETQSGAQIKTIRLEDLKSELDSLKERADLIWDGLSKYFCLSKRVM